MATIGLYWWGHGRMPMEKMAKRFFAEVEWKGKKFPFLLPHMYYGRVKFGIVCRFT